MEVLKRTLTVSTLFHLFFLGWLFLNQSLLSPKNEIFFVDFISPPSSVVGNASIPVDPSIKVSPPQPTKTVHSKEDLILKSKETKSSKVKENLIAIPQAPPIPKLMSPVKKENSSITEIPGLPGLGTGSKQGSALNPGVGLEVGSGGGAISGTNFQHGWYIQGMKKKLDSNWILYSQSLSRLAAQVTFTILKNGAVQKIEVENSSGNDAFDNAALRAVKSAAPLPPLPAEFSEKELRVHVRFSLKN